MGNGQWAMGNEAKRRAVNTGAPLHLPIAHCLF